MTIIIGGREERKKITKIASVGENVENRNFNALLGKSKMVQPLLKIV